MATTAEPAAKAGARKVATGRKGNVRTAGTPSRPRRDDAPDKRRLPRT